MATDIFDAFEESPDSGNATLSDGEGTLSIVAKTDKGTVRKSNQDAIGAQFNSMHDGALLVVADGMGGHEHGEYASCLTVDELLSAYQQGKLQTEQSIQKLFRRLDSAIKKKYDNCGTTCVMAIIDTDGIRIANIGDSRAYLLRGGQLRQLTHDDSLVQDLLDKKRITEKQAATHPRRNVLTKALGHGKKVEATFTYAALMEDDVVMLCSDGLHGSVSDEQIIEILSQQSELGTIADSLIGLALAQGSTDNASVAIAQHTNERSAVIAS